jgi:uncharacterized protein (UPF0261 family)
MAKSVAVVGTLDTKGEEIAFVKDLIEEKGHRAIVIDGGTQGEPPFRPDISHEEVAEAGGTALKEVAVLSEGEAVKVMSKGAATIVQELHRGGRLDGIIALGGTMGTWLGLAAMKALPLGVPRLMVSSAAFTSFVTPDMVSGGQMMTDCVAGLWGLNVFSKAMLRNAVGAILGMVELYEPLIPEKPLIGITTLGFRAVNYVPRIKPMLEDRGYEVLVFHTQGPGGRDFERLIDEGVITAALDLSLVEIMDHLYGGFSGVEPKRLEAAGRKGIPQVVTPGNTCFLCITGTPETAPPYLKGRNMHLHNPNITAVMTTYEEKESFGKVLAQKLNSAKGPTAVLLPLQGTAEFDKPGGIFYDPEGRKACFRTLKEHIEPKIEVTELDMHINDPAFSEEVLAALDRLMKAG